MKSLLLADGVVDKLSRSLQLDDGDPPNDLLPELEDLTYSPSNDDADAFDGFVDARQDAGHPITLVHLRDAISTSFWVVVRSEWRDLEIRWHEFSDCILNMAMVSAIKGVAMLHRPRG